MQAHRKIVKNKIDYGQPVEMYDTKVLTYAFNDQGRQEVAKVKRGSPRRCQTQAPKAQPSRG